MAIRRFRVFGRNFKYTGSTKGVLLDNRNMGQEGIKEEIDHSRGESTPPSSRIKVSYPVRGKMNGTEPITNHKSKNVMIAAERRDTIHISEFIDRFNSNEELPREFSVIRRLSTFYGPELMLYTDLDGGQNYLLTAPGPDAYLILWKAQLDERNIRKSYSAVAEVKAELDKESAYEICPDCGEPFATIEHERAAAIGECPNL